VKSTEAVLKFGWKKPKKNVCNIAGVRRQRIVSCSRFLALGIITNLAIIEKMFSLLPLKYLRTQSNDSAFTKLKEFVGSVLEEDFSEQESFTQQGNFVGFLLPVKLLLFKKTDTVFYRSTLYLLEAYM